MKTSDALDKIAPAMLAVAKAIEPVGKKTQAYGYKYADLVAICNELGPKLIANDLIVIEGGGDDENANPEMISCQLRIQHVSGQWIETGILRVKVNPAVKKDGSLKPLGPQDYMIVYSYLRRYLLVSAFMIPTVDDDAGGAQGRDGDNTQKQPAGGQVSPPPPEKDVAVYGTKAERATVGGRIGAAMATKKLDAADVLSRARKIANDETITSDELTLAQFKALADELEGKT